MSKLATSTIMLVEDEPDLRATTTKMLEEDGYQVHAFDNADKALSHVVEGGCKDCLLVVSDIKMQGMSGFELVRRMKEVRPELKVVLMSSFVIHKGEFQKVMPSLYIDDFVSKPFTKNDLINAIKNCAKNE